MASFVDVCRRRGLKVNADKRKVMLLNGEDRLECEFRVDGVRLEHVSKLKYLGCVLDESDTDEAECRSKVASLDYYVGSLAWLTIFLKILSLFLECFLSWRLCVCTDHAAVGLSYCLINKYIILNSRMFPYLMRGKILFLDVFMCVCV